MSDEGATMVEVLVALVLLALLAVAVAPAVGAARRAAGVGTEVAVRTVRILQADTALRAAIRRVRPPFWLSGAEVRIREAAAVLPYYEGRADEELALELRDGWLLVTEPGREPLRLGPYTAVTMAPLTDEDGRVSGLQLTLRADRAETVMVATFGSRPVAPGESP